MTQEPRKSWLERMDRVWLSAFPILCFAMGAPAFLYEVFVDRPRDSLILGISAIACGLGPVGGLSLASIWKSRQ